MILEGSSKLRRGAPLILLMPSLSLAPLPLFHFYRDNLSIGKIFIDDHPGAEVREKSCLQA